MEKTMMMTPPKARPPLRYRFEVHTKAEFDPIEVEQLIENYLKKKYKEASYVEFKEL